MTDREAWFQAFLLGYKESGTSTGILYADAFLEKFRERFPEPKSEANFQFLPAEKVGAGFGPKRTIQDNMDAGVHSDWSRKKDVEAFEAFKRSWSDYPSQDNEGYVPDRGGFKAGWFAALRWQSGLKE